MTTLRDLTGPWPMSLPSNVGYADRVKEYSLGGNDLYNDCAFPSLANWCDTVWAVIGTPMTMSEAECEHFYSVETGFDPGNKATDKGAVLFLPVGTVAAGPAPGMTVAQARAILHGVRR